MRKALYLWVFMVILLPGWAQAWQEGGDMLIKDTLEFKNWLGKAVSISHSYILYYYDNNSLPASTQALYDQGYLPALLMNPCDNTPIHETPTPTSGHYTLTNNLPSSFTLSFYVDVDEGSGPTLWKYYERKINTNMVEADAGGLHLNQWSDIGQRRDVAFVNTMYSATIAETTIMERFIRLDRNYYPGNWIDLGPYIPPEFAPLVSKTTMLNEVIPLNDPDFPGGRRYTFTIQDGSFIYSETHPVLFRAP